MISKFDHVTITVADVAAAAASYERLLGRPPRWRGTHPELGTSAALFSLSNGMIELMGPSPDAPDAPETEALREALEAHGDRLQTLSLGTEDAAAATRLLRERGLRATPPQEGEARGDDGALRSYRLVELSPRSTRGLSISVVQRGNELAPSHEPAANEFGALDHVVIASSDLDRTLIIYRDQLGLRLALDREVLGRRMLFFRIGGVTLEVVHDAALGESDSLVGLAYRVADLDGAHARLSQAGFDLNSPRDGLKPGTRVFAVRGGTHGVPTLVIHDPSRASGLSGTEGRV